MQTIIRRATLKDAELLSSLGRQTFYDTFTGTCSEADMTQFLHDYFNVAQVKMELANENDFFFLLKQMVSQQAIYA